MKFKKVGERYIISIATGEKVMEKIGEFCERERINNASFAGIGAVNRIELAHYDVGTKKYTSKVYNEAYEVSNITGNVFLFENVPLVHAHITLGDNKFNTLSGHLVECTISVACELVLTVLESDVSKEHSEEIGLKLLKL